VPNGIDLARFERPQPLPELGDGRPTILFVGRLERRKGLGYLLRAFMELKAQLEDLRLVIVGDGPMRRWYAGFAARHGLEDVVMAGYVPASELPRYYASCDVFCAPNTGDESFGIVLLEAMASGKPIVATDIDGFRTVITPGKEGLLVERKSVRGLVRALRLLLDDSELRREMGRHGAETAQSYDWERILDEVIAIYHEAPSPAPPPLLELRLEPTMSPR
jgi:phosphatidyl-myo-inositol alpha-mannosyltransferase